VVERFKVTADNKFPGSACQVSRDEDTFNQPWYGTKRWKEERPVMIGRETICAAKNSGDYFNRQPGADPAGRTRRDF